MTKSVTGNPKGARLSAAEGKESAAPRREGPPQPHPDDWPAEISEPEFLELTQVYDGDEDDRRTEAPAGEQGEPHGRAVPGDAMQARRLPEREDERAQPEAAAVDDDDARVHSVRAPQDFIADPAQGRLAGQNAGPGPDTEPGEASEPYPAENARQGRIILDKPEKRALFVGGLVGMAIVVLVLIVLGT